MAPSAGLKTTTVSAGSKSLNRYIIEKRAMVVNNKKLTSFRDNLFLKNQKITANTGTINNG